MINAELAEDEDDEDEIISNDNHQKQSTDKGTSKIGSNLKDDSSNMENLSISS